MKHIYCAFILITTYGAILAGNLHKAPHLLNGRIADLFGYSFIMWFMLAACIVMLFYPPEGRK